MNNKIFEKTLVFAGLKVYEFTTKNGDKLRAVNVMGERFLVPKNSAYCVGDTVVLNLVLTSDGYYRTYYSQSVE